MSLHPVYTSPILQPHFEEVEEWPVALVGYSGTQGAERIDFADLGIDLDLKGVVGEGTRAGAPRPSLPTYSYTYS